MQDISTQTDADNKKNSWDESIRTIIYAIVLALVFRSFAFEPFHIPSGSMKNNLLIGDYLFVSKYSYGYSRYSFPLGASIPWLEGRIASDDRPARGDVVVFRRPNAPYIDYIKRVVGLPGDTIEVKNGVLYINGNALPQRYIDEVIDTDAADNFGQRINRLVGRYQETLPEGKVITILREKAPKPDDDSTSQLVYDAANNTGIFIVPEKHYFFMGDNRDNSRDSRFRADVGYVHEDLIVGRAEMVWFSIGESAELKNPLTWIPAIRGERFFTIIE